MASRDRDIRLDLFRGLSLFIILIDHTRGNVLSRVTPGNFGLSDAACVFICVSGYTVALAFGRVFRDSGWLLGTARVALRVWQLYIAQLVLLVVVAALPSLVRHVFGAEGYGSTLKLDYLFIDPAEALWNAVTLRYVPPGLDILPVYVALLAMVPAAMALARLGPRVVLCASVLLWASAHAFGWNLQADPSDGRGWFFDPFTWQMLFFAGFGLGMGWLVPPPRHALGTALAVALLVFGLAVKQGPAGLPFPGWAWLQERAASSDSKTLLDPLTCLHFLAVAYLGVPILSAVLGWFRRFPLSLLVVAGQQSLAVFLGTVVLADLGGVLFDTFGTRLPMQVAVNLGTMAALFALACLTAWFKRAPWKGGRPRAVAEPASYKAGPLLRVPAE